MPVPSVVVRAGQPWLLASESALSKCGGILLCFTFLALRLQPRAQVAGIRYYLLLLPGPPGMNRFEPPLSPAGAASPHEVRPPGLPGAGGAWGLAAATATAQTLLGFSPNPEEQGGGHPPPNVLHAHRLPDQLAPLMGQGGTRRL